MEEKNKLGVSYEGRPLVDLQREAAQWPAIKSHAQSAMHGEIVGASRRVFHGEITHEEFMERLRAAMKKLEDFELVPEILAPFKEDQNV